MLRIRKEALILLVGDAACFYAALITALFLRYQVIPTGELLRIHLIPFSAVFAVWLLSFFVAGLYEKHTLILKRGLRADIWNAQIANSVIAALFFYFVPFFGIAPKTNLFLVIVLSFLFVLYWRERTEAVFAARRRESAILISSGPEHRELEREINNNPRYDLRFSAAIDLDGSQGPHAEWNIIGRIRSSDASVVVADFNDDKLEPVLAGLYDLWYDNIRLIQMHRLYEDIFDRIPLSVIGHSWFLENISTAPKRVYDALKRAMDVFVAVALGIATLPLYAAAWIAVKLDDGGPLLFSQERVGQYGRRVRIYKLRSMSVASGEGKSQVTRVGKHLRRYRIDELPQLWNVLKGDLSLIGPRPETPELAEVYDREIPYYRVRHILKPGLSGWAQLYHKEPPKFGVSVDQTREKLSYDLYYVKNRSLLLDIKIALRTIQTLISRSGV